MNIPHVCVAGVMLASAFAGGNMVACVYEGEPMPFLSALAFITLAILFIAVGIA